MTGGRRAFISPRRSSGESAAKLMAAVVATVYEFDGTLLHLRSLTPANWPHAEALRGQYPRLPDVDLAAGRVILQRAILHQGDVQTDPATPRVTRASWGRMICSCQCGRGRLPAQRVLGRSPAGERYRRQRASWSSRCGDSSRRGSR